MDASSEKPAPWYAKGLRFKCTQCGQCCTGAPGYIWVNDQEILAMADHLNLTVEQFSYRYLRRVGGNYSLKEHPRTYDCIFLKDNKCSVYSVRPQQCRTFPWWPSVLESERSWKETAKTCEGINHPDAPLISAAEIGRPL